MTTHTSSAQGRGTVVVVGGKGGLLARYREAIEQYGYKVRCYEDRVPARCGPSASKIALVIVMVTMVSHPLMTRARALAGEYGRIVYLKSPSVSSVRQTMEAVAKDPELPRRWDAA